MCRDSAELGHRQAPGVAPSGLHVASAEPSGTSDARHQVSRHVLDPAGSLASTLPAAENGPPMPAQRSEHLGYEPVRVCMLLILASIIIWHGCAHDGYHLLALC